MQVGILGIPAHPHVADWGDPGKSSYYVAKKLVAFGYHHLLGHTLKGFYFVNVLIFNKFITALQAGNKPFINPSSRFPGCEISHWFSYSLSAAELVFFFFTRYFNLSRRILSKYNQLLQKRRRRPGPKGIIYSQLNTSNLPAQKQY